jgi:hypothetical protein
VLELASVTQTPAPHIAAVYGLTHLLARQLERGQGMKITPKS